MTLEGYTTRLEALEEDLRRKLQRDINCLYDPDRNTRRRSLAKIKKQVVEEPTGLGNKEEQPLVLRGLFLKHLQRPLLQLATDPVEKCRELSLSTLISFISPSANVLQPQDVQALTLELIPLIRHRVGVAPFAEPTEEIRLLLIQLINSLLAQDPSWEAIREGSLINDLAAIVARELMDSFPDVKRSVCTTIELMASKAPKESRLHIAPILQALVLNLNHQHSKVRQLTLQALGSLLCCGSDTMERVMQETVLPVLKKLVFDRTPSMRKELVLILSRWLKHDGNTSQTQYYFKTTEADLLALLMLGLSDDSPDVQQGTERALCDVGRHWWMLQHSKEGPDPAPEGGPASDKKALDTEDKGMGIRAMTRSLLPVLLPKVLEDTAHWTVRTRHRSALALGAVVKYAGEAIVAFLPQILATLCHATADEEPEVVAAVDACGQSIGEAVDPNAILDLLLPQVRGLKAGLGTVAHRVAALSVLQSTLKGCALGQAEIDAVTASLVDSGVLEVEGPGEAAMMGEVLEKVVKVMVQRAPKEVSKQPSRERIVRVVIQVMSMSSQGDGPGDLGAQSDLLKQLAEVSGWTRDEEGMQKLLAWHFSDVVGSLREEGEGLWRKEAPKRLAFDTLVRVATEGVSQNLPLLIPIFVSHLSDEGEPELRLAMMLLLETLIEQPACQGKLCNHAATLISKVIMPNAVWKAGRVASTIRKVSLVCLWALLKDGHATVPVLYETVPALLPILKTDLEDYDASSRQLVALSLEMIFRSLPGAFDEEPIRQLYPELLKRLDDSSDEVRRSICATLKPFILAANPQVFASGILDYMMDQLLVHLDDQDPSIQEAVLGVIKVAGQVDPTVVRKKVEAARGSHRSPRLCDDILHSLPTRP